MKLSFKYFALVLMGALISGCAEEVEDLQPSANGTVTMKTTISLSEQASTRALTEAGVKTFAAGDQIAVIYKNTSDETVKVESTALTATDIDATDAHKATFSVTLTNPKASTPVRYIYPASRAAETVATTTAPNDDATIKYDALATQVGTFDKIASDLDLSVFDGEMTAQAVLPAATLVNPLTIAKFTIKNNATDGDITNTITKLTIADGTNTYTVNTSTLSTIYVAMKPICDTQTVNVYATDGTKQYYKIVTDNALDASKIYDVTVKTFQGVDLSKLTTNYTALDGDILSGTLDVANYPVKISIADGATVTLNGVTINGVDNHSYYWAGINCEGDATIILADGSTNTVKGFDRYYPGIIVAEGYTLTISGGALGTGKLNASSHYYAAGIGGGYNVNCGNITISGGIINATGGQYGAGIGGGDTGSCGNITISGGTITATGGWYGGAGIGGGETGSCGNITISSGTITATGGNRGAGIGGGNGDYYDSSKGKCGNITITNGVNKVEATKGGLAQHSIGKGTKGDCGTVTIDGNVVEPISTSPYTYQPPAAP